jgi:hypothetical protein
LNHSTSQNFTYYNIITTILMSAQTTNTGKPADPYSEANLDKDISLKDKVHDLVTFIEKCQFCMMATRIASSGLIVSRCMALAANVHTYLTYCRRIIAFNPDEQC